MSKQFVLLINGDPSRYYKDGQIKTYQTRENAARQARREHASKLESNRRRAKWNTEGANTGMYPPLPIPTYATAKFAAIEIEEVVIDDVETKE